MGDIEGKLERTVASIKETYAKCKLNVTGRMEDYIYAMNSKNKRVEDTWKKVAFKCIDWSVNPRAYVEWCFFNEYPAYPMPYKFGLDKNFNFYMTSGKPDPQYQQHKLRFELMFKKMEKLSAGQDVLKFLQDPLNTFDEVFIYAVAKNLGVQGKLPQNILSAARRQAFCHPVYLEKFNDFIPQEVLNPWI